MLNDPNGIGYANISRHRVNESEDEDEYAKTMSTDNKCVDILVRGKQGKRKGLHNSFRLCYETINGI